MTDWPPTGGTGGTGSHPPAGGRSPTGQTSPSWSVSPTGSTPASPGGISPRSRRRPFGAGLSREARLAITVAAALIVVGIVIGLILWATSGDDDSEDAVEPVVTTTTTAAPATTAAPLPTVSVPPPPPPPPATTAAPTTTTTAAPGGYDPDALGPAVPPDVAGFPSQQAWAAMRECQTGGDYTEVSEDGTNYGAYQFRIETWDELAGRRYPSLVGVLPSEASPADQDRMAYALWQEFGSTRWPECRSTIDPTPPPTTAAPAAQQTTTTTTAPATGTPSAAPTPPTTQSATPPTLPSIDLSPEPGPTTTTTITAAPSSLPTAAQWALLRQCESNGNYTVRSANGLYYGAYQFDIRTWDDVAGRHAPLLVGVLPSEASEREQDFLAQKLWDERGRGPWPVCGVRHLPENPDL